MASSWIAGNVIAVDREKAEAIGVLTVEKPLEETVASSLSMGRVPGDENILYTYINSML